MCLHRMSGTRATAPARDSVVPLVLSSSILFVTVSFGIPVRVLNHGIKLGYFPLSTWGLLFNRVGLSPGFDGTYFDSTRYYAVRHLVCDDVVYEKLR